MHHTIQHQKLINLRECVPLHNAWLGTRLPRKTRARYTMYDTLRTQLTKLYRRRLVECYTPNVSLRMKKKVAILEFHLAAFGNLCIHMCSRKWHIKHRKFIWSWFFYLRTSSYLHLHTSIHSAWMEKHHSGAPIRAHSIHGCVKFM